MSHPEIEAVLRGESRWCVIEGDNADYRASFPKSAAIVSDPPYGMKWNTDSTRFTGRAKGGLGRSDWKPIAEDDKPFDPAPWLDFAAVVLFGMNHFAQRLPVGTTLVWTKRRPEDYGMFLSDAELAWMKGGYGVYCFLDATGNFARIREGGAKWRIQRRSPLTLCSGASSVRNFLQTLSSSTPTAAAARLASPPSS